MEAGYPNCLIVPSEVRSSLAGTLVAAKLSILSLLGVDLTLP